MQGAIVLLLVASFSVLIFAMSMLLAIRNPKPSSNHAQFVGFSWIKASTCRRFVLGEKKEPY